MTRRARWTRPLAALFALWFAVVVGDPGLLHSCPMHGGHAMAGMAASAGMQHHSATSAEHASEHASMDHATQHDASHHAGNGPCTCVGSCCVAPAVAPLPGVPAMHVPATVAHAKPVARVAFVVAPAAPDTRLPFANGPPTA
jgi:hypothetical protein